MSVVDDIKSYLWVYCGEKFDRELDFPTFDEIAQRLREFGNPPYELTLGAFNRAMLQLIDEGVVGSVGHVFCWPEVAKEDYARLLRDGHALSPKRAA